MVHLIFWGTNWNSEPGTRTRTMVTELFEGLQFSEYQGILTQYFDSYNSHIGGRVQTETYTDTSVSAPSGVDDESIRNEVAAAIKAHPLWGPSSNNQFIVLPAPGTNYAAEFTGFCAYHDYESENNTYAIVPYAGDEPFGGEDYCDSYYGKGDAAKATSLMASHEYAEAATDPYWDKEPGWKALDGNEIADICATPYDELPNGTFVQGLYDDHQNRCSDGDEDPPWVLGLTDTASNVGEHSATINATVYPEGNATTYQFEWGTTTSYGNVAPASEASAGSGWSGVGESASLSNLQREQVYHYRIRVKSSKGTDYGEDSTFVPSIWTIHPQSAPERTGSAWLNDISCVAGGQCMTVGYYYNANLFPEVEGNQPLTYSGSGSSWTFHSAPIGPPSEEGYPELKGVSCSASSACTAVGEIQEEATDTVIPLIERWNGSSWSRQSVSPPSGSEYTKLNDVSCPTSSECIAVGDSKNSEGNWVDYSARWNGAGWSNLTTPTPEGVAVGETSKLEDVSCPSTGHCEAVGWYNPASGEGSQKILMSWNGSSWTLQSAAESSGWLGGIECLSSESCIAVGGWGTAIERWDGSEWSEEETPKLAHGGFLEGISCASETYCVATGGAYPKSGRAYTLSEVYSEGQWRVRETPRESEYAANQLWSVACTETTSCTAVGGTKAPGPWNPLIETKPDLRPGVDGGSVNYPNAGEATLKGEVKPFGFATHYHIEWGTKAEYEAGEYSRRIPTEDASAGSGETYTAVEQTITGLEQAATYHYRIVAESPEGKTVGTDHSFTTPAWPVLTLSEASEVVPGAAHLSGTINPKGHKATYRFEYVNQAHYEAGGFDSATHTPVPDGSISASSEAVSESATLKGLEPHTTYHFRLWAQTEDNESAKGGFAFKEGGTFTTPRAFQPPVYALSFGTKGTGNGEVNEPRGIAVDPSGNLWVSDTGNNRVQKFNSKGEYQCQIGSKGSGTGQFSSPHGLASDSEGNLWVADTANNRIEEISSECKYVAQVGKAGSGEAELSEPRDVAIDPSGNLWVADAGNHRIEKFGSKGEYLAACGSKGTANGQFEAAPLSIGTDADGNVWAGDEAGRMEKFTPHCDFLASFNQSSSKAPSKVQPADFALDSEGNLWIPSQEAHDVQGFYPEGEYLASFGAEGEEALADPVAIGAAPNGALWVLDDSESEEQVSNWVPGDAYVVVTGQATALKRTEATLTGQVNPKGKATSYYFEYGTTQTFGNSIPATPKSIGSGTEAVSVSEDLDGLEAGMTYYYHLVATTEAGTTYGETRHFTMLPKPGPDAKWRIGGKTFAELGIEEAPISFEGQTRIEIEWGTLDIEYDCDEWGSGMLTATGPEEEHVNLECTRAGASKECEDASSWYSVNGSYESESGFIAISEPEECFLEGLVELGEPSGSFEYGTEAGALNVNLHATATFLSGNPVTITGDSHWFLTGAQMNKTLGLEEGPPEVFSEAATAVKATEATLHGTVNPLARETSYGFEYGTTTAYGSSAPLAGVGEGNEDVPESTTIAELEPETTYHFRILAHSNAGTSYGKDETFTTPAAPNPHWRLEGSILAELEAFEVPYESKGAFTLEGTVGTTAVTVHCTESGSGTLGFSESITLSACETKLNGNTSAACKPKVGGPIELDDEFRSESEPLITFTLGEEEECAVGEEMPVFAGEGFSMQAEAEAVEFPASMSEDTHAFASETKAHVSISSTWTLKGKYEGSEFGYL